MDQPPTHSVPAPQPLPERSGFQTATRVITVTSGKGGVGKTNLTANLAIALARLGKKVMILDADLGLANIDILLNIRPAWNISHLLNGSKTLEEIVVEGPEGIRIVPASSGVSDLANLGPAERSRLIEAFGRYPHPVDLLLIDTSAGISDNVIHFVLAADETLLVTTPEPTSITDAYALIKVVARRGGQQPMGVVLNRAHNTEEANRLLRRLTLLSRRFLNFELTDFGFLFDDPSVPQSVRHQIPFIIDAPTGPAARGVRDLARRLLNLPMNEPLSENGLNRFLKKIATLVSPAREEE